MTRSNSSSVSSIRGAKLVTAASVDEHVEAAEVVTGALEQPLDVIELGHVGPDSDGFPARTYDLVDDAFGGFIILRIIDQDAGAFTPKCDRYGPTDASRRACDDCSFPTEPSHVPAHPGSSGATAATSLSI